MIPSKEMFPLSAVGGYIGARKTEKTFRHIFFIHLPVFRQCIQISVDLLIQLRNKAQDVYSELTRMSV